MSKHNYKVASDKWIPRQRLTVKDLGEKVCLVNHRLALPDKTAKSLRAVFGGIAESGFGFPGEQAVGKKITKTLELNNSLEKSLIDNVDCTYPKNVSFLPSLPRGIATISELSIWLTKKTKFHISVDDIQQYANDGTINLSYFTLYCELREYSDIESIGRSLAINSLDARLYWEVLSAELIKDGFDYASKKLSYKKHKYDFPINEMFSYTFANKHPEVIFYRGFIKLYYIKDIDVMQFMVDSFSNLLEDIEKNSAEKIGITKQTIGKKSSSKTYIQHNQPTNIRLPKKTSVNDMSFRDGLDDSVAKELYAILTKEKYITGEYSEPWKWMQNRNELYTLIKKLKDKDLIRRHDYDGVLQYIVDPGESKKTPINRVGYSTDNKKLKAIDSIVEKLLKKIEKIIK